MTTPTPGAAQATADRGHLPSAGPVVPVVLLALGAFLTWFGVHYWRSTVALPTDVLKSVLQGKGLPPATRAPVQYTPVGDVSGAVGDLVLTSGFALAADALRYVGQGYVYGGRADHPGDWDCSSFLSYVLGHDFRLPLPGGGSYGDPGYPPNAHGPVASAYKLYGTGINQQQVQAGDLAVWNTHCGIATNNTQIVAARTTATGTGTSTINGVTQELGETPVFRRLALPGRPVDSAGGGGGRAESIR